MEAFVDTSAPRCFITPSLVLSYKAFLFTPQMLCWFSIPRDIGCRLDSFSYLPPSSGKLLGVCSVAAEEERGMGASSYHFIRSLYSASGSPVSKTNISPVSRFPPVLRFPPCSLSHSFSQTRSINNASLMDSSLLPPVADSQTEVAIAYDTIREGAESYTTDEVNFNQLTTDEVAHYSHVVIMPSVQRHRLLSLLEQALSMLTPNNPTSASFDFAEFAEYILFPTKSWYSQKRRVAYEAESLCQLHTVHEHPGRFGTKGPFFYKLENHVACRSVYY